MTWASEADRVAGARRFARALFVVAFVALCAWLLWSFIPALAWALVIAIATWPLRQRCIRAGMKPASTAALMAISAAILAVLPFAVFGAEIAREAASIAQLVDQVRQGQLNIPDWLGRVPLVGGYAAGWWQSHLNKPVSGNLLGSAQTAGALQFGRDIGRSIVRRVVILGFTILTLFFLYKDGDRLARDGEIFATKLFGPVAKRYDRFAVSAIQATVNGLVFVGLGEGVLLGIAYLFCGVPHPIAFAVATGIFGIMPFGAPVVLAIASLTLILSSRLAIGLALLGTGLVAVFIADHTARPALIGGSIRLPFFWALLGVFGGLEAFGIIGLFLGPAILAIAVTMWREAAEPAAPSPRGETMPQTSQPS